jgi:hypothetical protein
VDAPACGPRCRQAAAQGRGYGVQRRDRVKTPSVTPDGVPPPSRREARLPLRGGCRRRRLGEFRNRRI